MQGFVNYRFILHNGLRLCNGLFIMIMDNNSVIAINRQNSLTPHNSLIVIIFVKHLNFKLLFIPIHIIFCMPFLSFIADPRYQILSQTPKNTSYPSFFNRSLTDQDSIQGWVLDAVSVHKTLLKHCQLN